MIVEMNVAGNNHTERCSLSPLCMHKSQWKSLYAANFRMNLLVTQYKRTFTIKILSRELSEMRGRERGKNRGTESQKGEINVTTPRVQKREAVSQQHFAVQNHNSQLRQNVLV